VEDVITVWMLIPQCVGNLDSEQTQGRWTAEFILLTPLLLPAMIPAES